PAVARQTCREQRIRKPAGEVERESRRAETPLRKVAEPAHSPGQRAWQSAAWRRHKISFVNKNKRGEEVPRSGQVQPRAQFDHANDAFETEPLKMTSATEQHPVQTIAEAPAVRNRYEQAALWFQNTAYFADGSGKVAEMLQAMVADD